MPVESDMLSWSAYDAERRLLELGFTNAAVYRLPTRIRGMRRNRDAP